MTDILDTDVYGLVVEEVVSFLEELTFGPEGSTFQFAAVYQEWNPSMLTVPCATVIAVQPMNEDRTRAVMTDLPEYPDGWEERDGLEGEWADIAYREDTSFPIQVDVYAEYGVLLEQIIRGLRKAFTNPHGSPRGNLGDPFRPFELRSEEWVLVRWESSHRWQYKQDGYNRATVMLSAQGTEAQTLQVQRMQPQISVDVTRDDLT